MSAIEGKYIDPCISRTTRSSWNENILYVKKNKSSERKFVNILGILISRGFIKQLRQ